MAYQDALFQLGMDLTRSSTAQKEDHCVVTSAAHEEPKLHSEWLDAGTKVKSEGRSLFIDLHGAARLADAKSAERALKAGLAELGQLCASVAVRRTGDGRLAGLAQLSSGRLTVSANPKTGYVAIDIQGGALLDPHGALFALADAFGAREAAIQKARCSDAVFLPGAKPAKARPAGKVGRARIPGAKAEARAA